VIDNTADQKSDSEDLTARSGSRVQITVSLQRHQRDLVPLRTLRSTRDPGACGATTGTPIGGLVQDERTRREFIERLLDDHGDDLQGNVVTRLQIESTVGGHGLAVPWWFIAHPDYQIGQGFLVPVIRAPAAAAPRGTLGGYRAHLHGVRMVRLCAERIRARRSSGVRVNGTAGTGGTGPPMLPGLPAELWQLILMHCDVYFER